MFSLFVTTDLNGNSSPFLVAKAVHSSLQQRSSVLDLDYRRTIPLPVDNDTDLE